MASPEILPQEKVDTKDAQTQQSGDTNFDKLENTLKNKIPSDEKKYNKFLTIFQNIQEQKSFSEDEICIFIKSTNTNFNVLNRDIGNSTGEDSNKIVLENIDNFFKTTIRVSTNKEQISELKEVKESQKTEVKAEKTEVKAEKTNKEILVAKREATQQAYNDLDDKNKITDAQLQKEKANIPQRVIDAVNKKTQDTDFKADEFLKFYLIGENKDNKDKSEYKDFMTKYVELKKELEIPDVLSFGEVSKPKNIDNIVESNKGLKNYANNSDKLDKIAKPTLPEIKGFDKEFATYVKFIPDENIKERIEKNKTIIKEFKALYEKDQEDARDEKGKQAYDEYMSAIDEVKKQLPERTQSIIKQRVLGTCITGLAKYFDTTTINKDNFANDFDINTQDGFTINKGSGQNETNDDILYINGNIKGNTIGFYYNLTNPEAQLKSDDFLHFDGVSETFAFGRNGGGKNSLGVILPTITELSAQAQIVADRNFTQLVEESGSIESLEASLKQKVSNELLKNYTQEALIKTRVERDIEKNRATQTLHNTFIPEVVATEMNKEAINKITKTKARKLLEIRDKSTENMRSDECRRLKSLIQRLDPLIAKEKHKNLEPKREKLLGEVQSERGANSYDANRGTNTLKFFKKFSKDNKINLQDLEIWINGLEKEESIGENISKFSPDFQTGEEKDGANKLLQNIT